MAEARVSQTKIRPLVSEERTSRYTPLGVRLSDMEV